MYFLQNSKILTKCRRFLRNTRGNVAFTFGLTLLPLIGAVGLATDSSLALMVRNQLSESLDTAGLAAGRAIFSDHAEIDAQQFFQANFPHDFLDSSVTAFDVQIGPDQEFVTLTASATVPTRFMKIWGKDSVTVQARTVVHRANRGMELALIMDNTGSMRSGGKMSAMKAAAHKLIDNIYGDFEEHENLWVSLVPYTAAVNIGANNDDWLDPADQYFDADDPFAPSAWKGCVEARIAPLDQTDATPASAPFTSYLYAEDVDNDWTPLKEANNDQNNGTGPNLGCGPPIMPLTSLKTTVHAAIEEMLPWHRGGTTGNLGLVWGWRTISPEWRGLWEAAADPINLPLDYNTDDMEKVVVILTDGQNQFYDWKSHGPDNGNGPFGSDYTAYGRLNEFGFASLSSARAEIDLRFGAICEAMKANDVEIFTITFGSTPNSSTQNLYRTCATTSAHYFHAPNNATLDEHFEEIVTELSKLRISE